MDPLQRNIYNSKLMLHCLDTSYKPDVGKEEGMEAFNVCLKNVMRNEQIFRAAFEKDPPGKPQRM